MLSARETRKLLPIFDENEGWDGRGAKKGKTVQQDVYVYLITLKDEEGKPHKLQGSVTVVSLKDPRDL